MKYTEIKKDLFEMDSDFVFAHCISKDCKMGAGIAKEFNRRFPKMKARILEQNPKVGEALSHYSNKRLVFNLITKVNYWDKPTYESFTATIEDLKDAMETLNLNKLAIPLLGAGLDRLSWAKNREIIKGIFAEANIEIVVCKI